MPDSAIDVAVRIHPSQFPHAVAAAMQESLRSRRMNHKFHYDSPRQTLRWLRVHAAYSPACNDPGGTSLYQQAALAAAAHCPQNRPVDVLSLGSGGGQKDAQLLAALAAVHRDIPRRYIPVDVSVGLTLVSRDVALAAGLRPEDVVPYVMDLAETADWTGALGPVLNPGSTRIILFYGMLPNFIPGITRDRLAALIRPGDVLLFSANLAPGSDYTAGVESIRPLYDNEPTREWLVAVLQDLGAEPGGVHLTFNVAECPHQSGLLRIEAIARFLQPTELAYDGVTHPFQSGDTFLLFFSYRHTPALVARQLAPTGLRIRHQWINPAGDEGVFLASSS